MLFFDVMERYEIEYYKMSSGRSNFASYFYIDAESLDEAKKTAKGMLRGVNPILPRIKKVSDPNWVNLEERI